MPTGQARITGGELAGRSVRIAGKTPAGFRPTAGRLREALFNILGNAIEGSRFLDLYAGSGIIAFEAMSRRAATATAVESSGPLCTAMRAAADDLRVGDRLAVVQGSLPGALTRVQGPFDIVYLDPPYALQELEATFAALAPHLAPGARVVYEHSSRYDPPQHPPGLELEQRRVYGDSAIALYCSSETE